MIDWNWPIEFTDGTPAWVERDHNGIVPGLVIAAEKPFGIAMAPYEKRGLFSLLTDEHDPRLRNVELPEIRFDDAIGGSPTGGTFANSGRSLRLFRGTGVIVNSYAWPTLTPIGDSPKLKTMSKAQLAEELEKEKAAAVMEASDFYGMF